jgi:hypothetical protein
MISFEQLDSLADSITELFEEFELSVIRDIARRLVKLAIPSAAWQVQRLTEAGSLYAEILRELSILTGKSEKELRAIFEEAGVRTIKFDDKIFKAAGLKPLPFSPAMAQTLLAGLQKTQGVLRNLTLTTALSGQQMFIHAADLAYAQVVTGAMDYNSAIRMAIKNVGASGLEIIYPSGHRDKLDVAMRRTVLTGVAQTAAQIQLTHANEMGQDLVQVSAHVGARNEGIGPQNHESWQGGIYSRSGTHEKYKPFVQTTGFGTGEGLGGWNCRHSFYPFFEGLSEAAYKQSELDEFANKTVKFNGKEMSVYEASQIQREIERKIRHWKRQKEALAAAGLENIRESAKVREWQARMRTFIDATKLQRQREREQVL